MLTDANSELVPMSNNDSSKRVICKANNDKKGNMMQTGPDSEDAR